ncbi:MAG: hypothetical protein ACLPZM_08760, partial [Thermoplasmata archaeon]
SRADALNVGVCGVLWFALAFSHRPCVVLGHPAATQDRAVLVLGHPAAAQHRALRLGQRERVVGVNPG